MSWVFQHSEAEKGARLVLLALADHAHDDGTMAFPAVVTIAKKARLSPRAVQYALRSLERDGMIKQTGTTARSGTRIYSILMGAKVAPLDREGRNLRQAGVQPTAPEPSVEPLEGVGARAHPLKISGKKVNSTAWGVTERILAEFNKQTSKKLRLLTSAGQPSEAAKRIYLRVITYPDITSDEHADIIRRTLASRWWGEDPPSIGVVYGPKVFEDNITREAKKSAKAAKADANDERKMRAARGLAAIQRIIEQKEDE